MLSSTQLISRSPQKLGQSSTDRVVALVDSPQKKLYRAHQARTTNFKVGISGNYQ